MDELLLFIKDVGFPIVVTIYLLYRIEGKLEALNTSIQSLPVLLSELIKK
ncbi:YvrJ family protein [Pradoshia sp.]